VVQQLLRNGARGDTLDHFGASPLTAAAAWANAATVKALFGPVAKSTASA